jgi:hypothetical protein
MTKMPSKKALEMAAQCWCDEETSHIEMDTALALAFAKRIDNLIAGELLIGDCGCRFESHDSNTVILCELCAD